MLKASDCVRGREGRFSPYLAFPLGKGVFRPNLGERQCPVLPSLDLEIWATAKEGGAQTSKPHSHAS